MRWLVFVCLMLAAAAAHAGPKLRGAVNINQAGISQLSLLPGVGPKRAKAIITLREKRPFRRAVQLRRVRGIGRRTLMKMMPYIRVQGVSDLRAF
jgi:competence protein ComEA